MTRVKSMGLEKDITNSVGFRSAKSIDQRSLSKEAPSLPIGFIFRPGVTCSPEIYERLIEKIQHSFLLYSLMFFSVKR